MIRDVTNTLFSRVCSDPRWLFLFLAISQAHLITYLYSSYLVLWLNSFVKTGELLDTNQVQMLYSRYSLVSIPSTVFTIMVTGILADCVRPVFLIAPAFLGRSVVTYLFQFIEDPTDM